MSSGRVRKFFDSWILQDWADRVVWNYQSTMGSAVWFEIPTYYGISSLVLEITMHCGFWQSCAITVGSAIAGQEIVLGIQSRLLTAIKTPCVYTEVTFKMHCACKDKFGNQLYLWIGKWEWECQFESLLVFTEMFCSFIIIAWKSLHRSKADWQLSASLLALWCQVGSRAGGGG